MNRRVIVPAPTARQSAARNESHLAGRQAFRRYRLNIRSPRRVLDTKPQTKLVSVINNECVFVGRLAAGQKNRRQRVKKATSQLVACPCCQEIISVLRKKFLVQLKMKISCLVAFEAPFLKGHDYAF